MSDLLPSPAQWLMLAGVALAVLLLWRNDRRMGRFLEAAEAARRAAERTQTASDNTLEMAKLWYEHGRTQHTDADWAAKKVEAIGQKVEAAIVEAVAPLPEKTAVLSADKTMAAIEAKAAESGAHKFPPAPGS